jgi:DGQHR domain-containing protein
MSKGDGHLPGMVSELRLPALELRQGTHTLYSFAVDGKTLPSFATVSRIHRNEEAEVQGYQRPQVLSHIASIRKYLESQNAMIPNALVIAFDSRVRFVPDPSQVHTYSRAGTLVIPVDPSEDEGDHPGWIVDGQQRTAAIREARISEFPVFVTAFITDDAAEQRAQFILVNSTRPLPKSLIYELLPTTDSTLPINLETRRFPARLLERLNWDGDSPLEGLIATPTTPNGLIKDNSVLRMLENSLTDGALYRWRDPATGQGDIDSMLRFLKNYWEAVSRVFPDAWALPPRKSRLMHGVGILSMGFVMDAIGDRLFETPLPTPEQFAIDLLPLQPVCKWTSGYWTFGTNAIRKWNELQNTQRDIQVLTNHLLSQYRTRVWAAMPGALRGNGGHD